MLKKIASKHQAYGSVVNQYDIGVTDGHRCAAQTARDFLARIDGEAK